MSGDTSEEKSLPPSDKKLREARKKGQISHSKEMVTAIVTTAAFGYLMIRGGDMFARLHDGLAAVPDLQDRPFDQAVSALAVRLLVDVASALIPLIGLIVASAILANVVVNGGVLAALDPVLPKMERLDPIAGFKRMFALRNLAEVLKSVVKVLVLGGLTIYLIHGALQALVELPVCGARCIGGVIGALLVRLLVIISGVFILLGGFDIGLQKWLFSRDMRMTKSEQKREHKESLGDPLIKRQRAQERRGNRSKSGLRNATFIIRSADVALALRYANPDALVPVLVAKGVDEGARAVLDEARQFGLPVVFDTATANSMAPKLKVGGLIPQEMFQAVIACMHEAKIL